jgi:SEC-C motif
MNAKNAKIGRNDLCWCGSGKKYKKCHLDREKHAQVQPWDIDRWIREQGDSGRCVFVGTSIESTCGIKAIGSHSVPKSMLKLIARKGHVYWHSATVQDLEKSGGLIQSKLIGINEASIVPTFCSSHDNDAFRALERAEFTGSREQCCLIAYRATCQEFVKKSNSLAMIPKMRELGRGRPFQDQEDIQLFTDINEEQYRISLRDLSTHKRKLEEIVLSRDFEKMRGIVVSFGSVPDILCSSILYPLTDFDAHPLQDITDAGSILDLVTFALIPTEVGSSFVLTWEEASDRSCRSLAASLDRRSDSDLPNTILSFILGSCENRYIRPSWFEGLDQNIRRELNEFVQRAVNSGSTEIPMLPKSSQIAKCRVTDRQWI